MPFYYDKYKEQVMSLNSKLEAYAEKRQALVKNPDISDSYRQTSLAKLDAEHADMVESTFNEIRGHIATHVKSAQEKIVPKNIPFDERTYNATAAAQDIANRSPQEIIALYDQAVKDGRRAYAIELQRVAEPAMIGSDHQFDWQKVVRNNMQPNELNAFKLRTLESRFNNLLNPMEDIMKEAQGDIAKGSAPYLSNTASVMDAVTSKVQQGAAEL